MSGPARRPICYIADEGGSNKVYLTGKAEPYPIPEPVWEARTSEHDMLAGTAAAGDTVIQDFGVGVGRLRFSCKGLTRTQKDAIETKFRNWTAGARAPVEFGITEPDATLRKWTCVFASWVPARRTKPLEGYGGEFDLTITEEL